MWDEEGPGESTFDLLPLTSGCQSTENVTHPFAEVDHVAESIIMYENESGGRFMTKSLPHTSGSTLEVRRGVEETAGNAPSIIIKDPVTDFTACKSVHTFDDEDDWPRMIWVKWPEYPPWKETKTLHPITSGMRARVSGGDTAETTWSEWPDQS